MNTLLDYRTLCLHRVPGFTSSATATYCGYAHREVFLSDRAARVRS
jgi:hypothetical protein